MPPPGARPLPPPGVRPLPQGQPGGPPQQGPGPGGQAPGGAPQPGPAPQWQGGAPGGPAQPPHTQPNPAPGGPPQWQGAPGGPARGPQGTQGFPGPPSGPYPRPGFPARAPLPPPAAAAPPVFTPAYAGPPPGAPFGPRFAPGYRPYVAKKSNTGVIVAVAIIGIVAVVGGLVAAVALIGGNTRHVADAGYSSTYPSDTYETTSARETTETTSSTEETTTSRTTERTTRTSEQPSGPRSVVATGNNPMFASADYGLQNVPCSLSRWATDQGSATRFFQSGIACLDAMWSRMLGAVDLPFRSPKLSVPQSLSESSTPCGSGGTTTGVTPFYCPSNDTIYMPMDRIEIDVWGNHPGPYLSILAHEYGHHVQNLAGITEAYGDQRYDAGADSAVGLELSRRMELEAQCFSGMFLGSASVSGGSVDKNIYNEAWNAQDRGDDYARNGKRDHGSARHNISWWQHGATKNRNQQCNTWLSASGDVS
ncbi:neutral zinc metallopeptidase [Amycolatopsis pretoriensis]|uniref:neutral zinc metallopeptidase n=1 Tax=Amycolatopsis pretoriensis TaxID=218821 RepID=UPI001FC9082F|nr:neutral zinc metallopeptidase [Amycolatopsis pretoriensis]